MPVYDYTHVRTEFIDVRAKTVNGPFQLHFLDLEPGKECSEMEEAYRNVAPSAGGFEKIYRCEHCHEEFGPGESILYHLENIHGIKRPQQTPA